MSIRLAINGAAGRMGQRLVALATADAELEVAAAIEYLISPLAKNVTGQQLTIDGGWTAQ